MADQQIRVRKTSKAYRDQIVEYDEKYAYDPQTKEEIYRREFINENKESLIESYKQQKGLLTSKAIKAIRAKYQMTQKEFSLALGFGEITVHRFEKGAVQTYADDEIMRLSNDPDDMYKLLSSNRDSFSESAYVRMMDTVRELQKIRRNRIAHLEKEEFTNLTLTTSRAVDVAKYLVKTYNHQYDWLEVENTYISSSKLQILMYFVEALALVIYNRSAFSENIYMGKLGPYIPELIEEYDHKEKIIENDEVYLTNGLHKIVDMVIESYGQLELLLLVSLCKAEQPIEYRNIDELIDRQQMKEYFDRIYD